MVPWGKTLFLSVFPLCLQHLKHKKNSECLWDPSREIFIHNCGRREKSRLFQLPTKDSTQALVKSKNAPVRPLRSVSLPPVGVEWWKRFYTTAGDRELPTNIQTAFLYMLYKTKCYAMKGPEESPGTCTVKPYLLHHYRTAMHRANGERKLGVPPSSLSSSVVSHSVIPVSPVAIHCCCVWLFWTSGQNHMLQTPLSPKCFGSLFCSTVLLRPISLLNFGH